MEEFLYYKNKKNLKELFSDKILVWKVIFNLTDLFAYLVKTTNLNYVGTRGARALVSKFEVGKTAS